MKREETAIEVLCDIALDPARMLAERQRAIDALTLFKEASLGALERIERTTDNLVLKERARLYVQRIKDGVIVSMNL
ncbi:MAG TPA: hypothetical protein PLS81_02895 [Deltaproteobacteria bacterium]|nr:hypothetical protein [Deltaproteobacteria bacterium]HPP80276.1 hypothetical protein [Deltaproteobacteria bacterium]